MTQEEHITRLEGDMNEMKASIKELVDIVGDLNDNIKIMNTGLYGDDRNNHIGVIKKQQSLEVEINHLKEEIKEIRNKNIEQDVILKARKGIWVTAIEIIKWGALAYCVGKGVFGFDTLFGKFF